ncbi:MAG TPA: hypothetical protein VIJ77_02580 [Candidatus Tumulicola sp.]|jgi:hypothetical protein
MEYRTELHRYLIIFALAAPTAGAVWFVFHGVFANLTRTEAAMGYVDSTTQMGIDLGYVAMVGGTAIFAAIAAWAALRAAGAWLHERGKG